MDPDMLESPPEPLTPKPAFVPGDLIGHVGVGKRRNAGDGSYTITLRWREWTERGPAARRLRHGRTGPEPTKRELRNSIAEARVKAQEVEGYLRNGQAPTQGIRRFPLRDAMAAYLDYVFKSVGRGTYDRLEMRVLHFVNWHCARRPDVQSLGGITPQHVRDYVQFLSNGDGNGFRPLKLSTVRLAVGDLVAMFAWCETRDWCRGNPAQEVRSEFGRKQRRKPPVILPDDVVRSICADSLECKLLFCTGLRVGDKEAAGLTWGDLSLEHGLLNVPEAETETTKIHGRTVPIGTAMLEMLGSMEHGAGVIFPAIRQTARKEFGRHTYAGRRVTPHDARRWYSTALKTACCPEPDILYLLGHVQGANMAAYYGFSAEEIRPYVQMVEDRVFSLRPQASP